MTEWMVWSNEHRGWWKRGGYGYTTLTLHAGRYSKEAAERICAQANIVPRDPPNEIMVLAPPMGNVLGDLTEITEE